MNAFEDRLRAGLRAEPDPVDADTLIQSVERRATRHRRLRVSAGVAAIALTVVGCVGVALAVSGNSQTEAPLLDRSPSETPGRALTIYNYELDGAPDSLRIRFETGFCDLVGQPTVDEEAEVVRLSVVAYPDTYSKGCPIPRGYNVPGGATIWSVRVPLIRPLGNRKLIDASSGRKIPLWDASKNGPQ